MEDWLEDLVGHLRSELVRRNRDPGVWLTVRPEEQLVRIRTGGEDGGWCDFSPDAEDLEGRILEVVASDMVAHALEGCGQEEPAP